MLKIPSKTCKCNVMHRLLVYKLISLLNINESFNKMFGKICSLQYKYIKAFIVLEANQ